MALRRHPPLHPCARRICAGGCRRCRAAHTGLFAFIDHRPRQPAATLGRMAWALPAADRGGPRGRCQGRSQRRRRMAPPRARNHAPLRQRRRGSAADNPLGPAGTLQRALSRRYRHGMRGDGPGPDDEILELPALRTGRVQLRPAQLRQAVGRLCPYASRLG